MKTTIKDVAKAAGVSIATVSMALNGQPGVNPDTRKHVLDIAGELNYVANYSARSLVRQESGCIGLLLPEIQNPFYSAIVDYLSHIAEDKGFSLLLGITNNSHPQEEKYTRYFISRGVQGVIVVPALNSRRAEEHLELLRAANIPIVFCSDRYKGSGEPVAMCDFEAGQYEITRLLIERGLKDFWFVSVGIEACFTLLRYKGFVRALTEAGIPLRKERELYLKTPGYNDAYEGSRYILEELPEAVVCINDIMTMAIIKRLGEAGIRVPEDISIVGFDDILFSGLLSPPLTTVRQPIREICERTMQLLEDRIADRHSHDSDDSVHLIRPRLILRGTTV